MKKSFLCILDGFGLGNPENPYNAVYHSINKGLAPNLKRILETYPRSSLKTSGEAVGLPDGQMGNSEVGHMTIGSGRVIYQDLVKINKAIKTGEIFSNPALLKVANSDRIHIMGIFSDGGVHGHGSHLRAISEFFANSGKTVFLHLISDGRDVSPTSFLEYLENNLPNQSNIHVATVSGRYFAMDRDNNDDRINQSWDKILNGGEGFKNCADYIKSQYDQGVSDEFIKPVSNVIYSGIEEGDGFIFTNFRSDRAKQIWLQVTKKLPNAVSMTRYSKDFTNSVIFETDDITNTMCEQISKAGTKQLHISETEKYAHVTFFLNGGREEPFDGEHRILIPSPKVATYNQQPEMSLPEVEAAILLEVAKNEYGFIVSNIANCDMVGHTGSFEAVVKAVTRVDEFLGKLEKECTLHGYQLFITADHGNAEEMYDAISNKPHTQHTTGEVPFIAINTDQKDFQNGSLADIAGTILNSLGIPHNLTSL